MTDYKVKGTDDTPTIELNLSEGSLLIKGRSIVENPSEFYKPLLTHLSKYDESPSKKIKVNFQLEYFNTSSSKSILQILKQLKDLTLTGNTIEIDWYYDEEDDDILEIGEDFSSMVKVPFNLKVISNN